LCGRFDLLPGHQVANDLHETPTVLDVTMKVEGGNPRSCPAVPRSSGDVVGIDEHAVVVEQDPVDLEGSHGCL
jgi:hypothetical protein